MFKLMFGFMDWKVNMGCFLPALPALVKCHSKPHILKSLTVPSSVPSAFLYTFLIRQRGLMQMKLNYDY